MNTLTMPVAPEEDAPPPAQRQWAGDLLLYVVLMALTFGVWQFSRQGWIHASDDVGYWVGVAGATAMLALLTYPMRKYLRFMHSWGKVKWWFVVHMTLGVAGPLLILLHAGFRVGSLNAGVALYSMIVVALSGVVGRFIKVRIHRGLQGEQSDFRQLQVRAGFVRTDARSRLFFVPRVEARLREFEQRELYAAATWSTAFRQVFVLPWQQLRIYVACLPELRAMLRRFGRRAGWTRQERARQERKARKLVWRYLGAVARVAQYSAYEKIFALWHVAHVPFVYLFVISAVVHVIAVHAY